MGSSLTAMPLYRNRNMNTVKYKTNLKKRIFATLIDYGVYAIITFVYIIYFGSDSNESSKSVSGVLTLPLLVVWFVYFVVIESKYKATLGHQAFDLKVITADRKEINFINAFKRHLVDPIDFLFYGIPAIIAIKNTEKHQRLGDLWSKTVIVDTSDIEQYPRNVD